MQNESFIQKMENLKENYNMIWLLFWELICTELLAPRNEMFLKDDLIFPRVIGPYLGKNSWVLPWWLIRMWWIVSDKRVVLGKY